jgi:hypothetical protein
MPRASSKIKKIILIFLVIFAFQGASAAKEPTLKALLRPSLDYDAGNEKDPFGEAPEQPKSQGKDAQTGTAALPLPSMNIQGLIWGGKFPQAIINGKVVKIGEVIEGAQIIEINKEGVVLSYDNRNYTLRSPAISKLENMQNRLQGGQDENRH